MYILKNALRNVRRAKLRNILIGLIVLIIAISSCLGLSIRQAAVNARQTGLESLSVTAQISMDRQSMMQGMGGGRDQMLQGLQKMEPLTLEQLQTYAKNENVKDFYYTLSVSVNGNDDLSAVQTQVSTDSESEDNQSGFGDMSGRGPGGKHMMGGMGQQGDFTLSAYSTFDAMTDFVDGNCAITSGTFYAIDATENSCVISDELATLNELEVGSSITLVNPNDEEEALTFTVVGIYHNDTAAVSGGMMQGFSAAMDPANTVYVPYAALRAVVDASAENAETTTDEKTGMQMTSALRGSEDGTFVFADADALAAFESSIELPEGYTVSSSDVERFEQSLIPLNSLSQFAGWFLIIVLLIGGLILVVFNVFSVRERKNEIGVLTAIGMKKSKVCLQFLSEMFVVTFVALIIGAIIGAAVSVPATNALLESQATGQQQQQSNRFDRFGFDESGQPPARPDGEQPDAMQDGMGKGDRGGFFGEMGGMMTDYITEVTSATDLTVLLQLLGIGLGLTLLSSLAALSAIMRYDPLKILSNA